MFFIQYTEQSGCCVKVTYISSRNGRTANSLFDVCDVRSETCELITRRANNVSDVVQLGRPINRIVTDSRRCYHNFRPIAAWTRLINFRSHRTA